MLTGPSPNAQFQATIFDAAFAVFGRNEQYFQKMLPGGRVRWVENYYGSDPFSISPAVGGRISNAAPAGGKQTPGDHTGPYKCYLDERNFADAFAKSIVLPNFDNNGRPEPREWRPDYHVIDEILTEISLGKMLAEGKLLITVPTGSIVQGVEAVSNFIITGVKGVGESLVNVLKLKRSSGSSGSSSGSISGRTANAFTGSTDYRSLDQAVNDVAISLNVGIPEGATTIVLPYRFTNTGAGDWLSVTFNNQQVLAVRGDALATTDWQRAEISTAGISGTSGILSIRLNAVGEASAEVSIAPISFVTPTIPMVISQPSSGTYNVGQTTALTVQSGGVGPLSYQWRKGGTPIAGATSVTLDLGAVTTASAGDYDVVITNSNGSVVSTAASVTVNIPSNAGRLINLSILTSITASDPLFTVGTVIGGNGTSGSKPLLVRAAGPSLTQFGVGGALPDPKLDLFFGQAVVGSNARWGGTAALSAAFAQVGAFAYASGTSKDSAISNAAMSIGAYTIQVSGVGGATGTVIAELYDATPTSAFTATTPRLINASVLKNIGTGLTAGFVIGGNTPKTVLVRAVGPGLATFGVGGLVADPQLTLFSGQTAIGSNDNWGTPVGSSAATASQLSAAFTQVGAFTLPSGSRDAAILTTLASGSYTVQVTGVGGTTGVALVEVYEVP